MSPVAWRRRGVAAALALLAAACDRGSAAPVSRESLVARREADAPAAWSVDSALEDFRAGLPRVDVLANAAPSPEALVREFADALERADTTRLAQLHLTRAEFAWLVYPESRWTRAPYRQPAEVTWLLIVQRSESGLTRLLQRRGGRPLHVVGFACDAAPEREGRATYRGGCTIRLRAPGGADRAERLFGSIVEVDGRFKIGSYGNQY